MSDTQAMRFCRRGLLALWAVLFACITVRAQESGEALFKAKCAMCHGPDGSGKTTMGQALKIPDLHSDQVQKMTDAELKDVIAKGKNKMPGYEGKLNKEQIEKLVAYIRALVKH